MAVGDTNAAASMVKDSRVVNVFLHRKREDLVLAADGFNCLAYSTNKGTWIGRPQFLWIRRNKEVPEDVNPILDINVVAGDGMPPHRYTGGGRVSAHRRDGCCVGCTAAESSRAGPDYGAAVVTVFYRRGYCRLLGNLNLGTLGKPLYLWFVTAACACA
jgi:hypothetical protein